METPGLETSPALALNDRVAHLVISEHNWFHIQTMHTLLIMLLTYYVITLWVSSAVCLVYILNKGKGFNIVGLVCVSYKMSQLLSYFEQCQLFVQNFGAPTREPQPCSAVTLWCRFCLVTPLEVVCEAVQLTHSSLPLLNPVVTFLPAAAAAAPRVTGRALTGSILFPQQGELLLCHVRPGAPVSDTELHLCRGTSAGRR